MSAFARFAIIPATVCLLVLGGSTAADSTRNAMPPPAPAFKPPANAIFSDDFQAARLSRWRADRDGVWSLQRGMLKAELPDNRQEHSVLMVGDSTWTDYAVDLDVCGMRGVDKGVVVRVRNMRGLAVDLRGPGYHDLRLQMSELPIGRAVIDNGNGVWHHVRVEVRAAHCRIVVNGQELINRRVPLRLAPSGGIALAAYTGGVAECTVFYDNVAVTPLATGGPAR